MRAQNFCNICVYEKLQKSFTSDSFPGGRLTRSRMQTAVLHPTPISVPSRHLCYLSLCC